VCDVHLAPLRTRPTFGARVDIFPIWRRCRHRPHLTPVNSWPTFGTGENTASIWRRWAHGLHLAPMKTRPTFGAGDFTTSIWRSWWQMSATARASLAQIPQLQSAQAPILVYATQVRCLAAIDTDVPTRNRYGRSPIWRPRGQFPHCSRCHQRQRPRRCRFPVHRPSSQTLYFRSVAASHLFGSRRRKFPNRTRCIRSPRGHGTQDGRGDSMCGLP
jgi:hypothetical protein